MTAPRRIAAVMCALLVSPVLAQEMAPPKPGKEHEILKQLAGEWDSTTRFAAGPGQDPMVSKGTEHGRIIAGGLFLVFDAEGEMMGSKFWGHGTLGYDLHKKKYTGSWIDSMATGVYLVEATYDEKSKSFSEVMEGAHPITGEPMKMKMVHEIKDPDHRLLRFLANGPEGKEIEVGAIEYSRKK